MDPQHLWTHTESNIVFKDSPSIVSLQTLILHKNLADKHLHHRPVASDSLHPHMVQAQQIQRLCYLHIHNVPQTQKLFSNVHISYICSIKKRAAMKYSLLIQQISAGGSIHIPQYTTKKLEQFSMLFTQRVNSRYLFNWMTFKGFTA